MIQPSFFNTTDLAGMEEIWKPVVGFDDYYEVSNHGRIKNTGIRESKYNNVKKQRIKSLDIVCGYLCTKLWVNGKCKHMLLHRAIAQAFIPNPDSLPCVNHKDCNKLNNNISNLEWVTKKQNAVHAWENGCYREPPTFWKGKFGKDHIQSKPIILISKDGIPVNKEYENSIQAGKELNLHARTIREVCSNRIKRYKGHVFIFKVQQSKTA
jgi:hypothetical protein